MLSTELGLGSLRGSLCTSGTCSVKGRGGPPSSEPQSCFGPATLHLSVSLDWQQDSGQLHRDVSQYVLWGVAMIWGGTYLNKRLFPSPTTHTPLVAVYFPGLPGHQSAGQVGLPGLPVYQHTCSK